MRRASLIPTVRFPHKGTPIFGTIFDARIGTFIGGSKNENSKNRHQNFRKISCEISLSDFIVILVVLFHFFCDFRATLVLGRFKIQPLGLVFLIFSTPPS